MSPCKNFCFTERNRFPKAQFMQCMFECCITHLFLSKGYDTETYKDNLNT